MAFLSVKRLVFATRTRLAILLSLVMTWWLAHLFNKYRSAVQTNMSLRIQDARRRIPTLKLDWKSAHDGWKQYNSSKLALLVEPRPLPHLAPLILHMISVVPPDWTFLFLGSAESLLSVGRAHAIKYQEVVGKLALVELPIPWVVSGQEDVFRMLTNKRFYNEFLPGVEWILKYEHDSILCANSETSVDEWLGWSWAGAPRAGDNYFSGYGGLSLRRVSAIKRVLSFQARQNDSEPEDEWFGKRLLELPGEKVASKLDAAFAIENALAETAMGIHAQGGGVNASSEMWDDAQTRRRVFEYCPELRMITDMKLERERGPEKTGDESVHTEVKQDADSRSLPGSRSKLGSLPPQPPPFPQVEARRG